MGERRFAGAKALAFLIVLLICLLPTSGQATHAKAPAISAPIGAVANLPPEFACESCTWSVRI